ncbi:T9SS type A sorting domain-containing protein [Pontibacter sp. HJ8]
MKTYLHGRLLLRCFLAMLVFLIALSASFAQTPGLIFQPATSGGERILDPNDDGYISATANGFSGTDDIGPGQSEIPYRAIPTLNSEPLGDSKNGTSGGHTDLASPAPLQAFFDGQNLLFRFRLGGISSSQRGYSVLIDSDNTFAGTGANPGFEFEVLLSSNSAVTVIQHSGNEKQTLFSGAFFQHSQKAEAASTGGGSPDYFYDFYVPLSAFNNQITATTPLRMAANTLNSTQSALTATDMIADVAGVDFRSYNQDAPAAWRDIIGTFPPLTLNDLVTDEVGAIRTFAPIISSPITTAATTIAGTSREPAGTVIQVMRNGTPIGTTTVAADGSWSLTLASGVTLAAGNSITATATAPNRPVSETSNTVVVTATTCATAAPTISAPSGNQRRALSGTATPGASIRLYRNGILVANTTATGTGTTGSWTYTFCTNGNNCIPEGVYTATQQIGSGCESNPSSPLNWRVNTVAPPTAPAPAVTTSPVCVSTTTISGTAAAGSFVTLFLNDRPLYLVTTTDNAYTVAAGADGTWSLTANLGYKAGDRLYVRARTASVYYGQSGTATVTSCPTTAPVITGEYCGVTSSVSGTSTEPAGTSIQVYAGGTAVGAPGTVNENGFWTVSGLSIPAGTAFTARATAPGGTQSVDSEPVTATPQTSAAGLTINAPIQEGAASITGTGPAGAQLTLYIDGTPFTPIVIPENGTWTLTGYSRSEIFAGSAISATVTAAGQCASEFAESVIVDCLPITTSYTVSSTSPDILCGGSGTVTVNLASSQLGVAYTLLAGDEASGTSVMGTGGAITLTSGPIANETAENIEVVISVRARRVTSSSGENIPASCEAILDGTVTRTILPQPPTDFEVTPLTSNICAGSTVTLQLSSSATGYTYQLLNEATGELVGNAVAGTGAAISLSTGPVNANASYGIVITNTANNCVLTDPARYTAVISGPAIDRPVFAERASVCVGGPAAINVSTEANAGYTYRIFQTNPGGGTAQLLATFTGTGEVVKVNSNPLPTAGTYTFYAEVSSASCPARRMLETATVRVTNEAGVANAGEDQTVCGTEGILAAASPAPGVGTWSTVSKPAGSGEVLFADPNNPTTSISGLVSGEYVFEWSVTTSCGGTATPPVMDRVTVTVNCEATYVIAPPKFRDEYVPGDALATAVDPDGGVVAAILLGGAVPPGVALNPTNGNLTVTRPELLRTGMYELSVRLTDRFGDQTDLTITLVISEDSPIIVPLPVELVYFTATVRDNQVTLQWLTASEQNNDRFEIERSSDAKSFEKVGTVKGIGNSSVENRYAFQDKAPVNGTVYYRLKQVDLDGAFAYSKVIAVSAKGLASELTTQVYPNPFTDIIKVTLTAPQTQQAELFLFDINGKQVLRKTLELEAGANALELSLQQLNSGMYILKIVGSGMESTTKIIKN